MLKILVDENITLAASAFSSVGEVSLIPGREITNKKLRKTDILIVRSITNVNEELLSGTPVKFVGTATIGTDHVDLEYLNDRKICFADAKGCNAYSVAEYVIASLLNLACRFDFQLKNKSIGIVGVGNVGSKVAAFEDALGMDVFLYDPPLKRSGDKRNYIEFDQILACDIVTLHTPLNISGIDKTYHLWNSHILNRLKEEAILINTSRGAVINNSDLINAIDIKKLKVILDVWENEPAFNDELLKRVLIGTPHVAGYSYEGKVNGTKMIYYSLCKYLHKKPEFVFPPDRPDQMVLSDPIENNVVKKINNLVAQVYPVKRDDEKMKKSLLMFEQERQKYFDLQRKNYPVRREFNYYNIKTANLNEDIKNILSVLRFNFLD